MGSCRNVTHGTPVIVVNVTGGLQDQCGFKNDKDEYLTAEDYIELKSNHRGTYKQHGEWVVRCVSIKHKLSRFTIDTIYF